MFGYRIAIFKKKKGITIEPETPVQKVVDVEYEAWKKAEAAKRTAEIREHNNELINKFVNERLDEYVDRYKSQVPQPFEVGEKVTYRFYNPHSNPFSIGYHGGPGDCFKTFKAPDLNGPFTFPVHVIKVSTELLEDRLRDKLPYPWMYTEKYTELDAERLVETAWREIMNSKNRSYQYWAEWIIDFDWETLKIPAGNCANEEGWLHLRWGGFNAGYFMNSDSPMAKKQRALWKKEKAYLDQKAKFEQELSKLKNEFEEYKNNLF